MQLQRVSPGGLISEGVITEDPLPLGNQLKSVFRCGVFAVVHAIAFEAAAHKTNHSQKENASENPAPHYQTCHENSVGRKVRRNQVSTEQWRLILQVRIKGTVREIAFLTMYE